MSKFRTYAELFAILGDGEGFGVKETEPTAKQSLVARLADDACLGAERFFGAREDIIATAKVREVRRYSASGREYVRFEFRVLDPHGDWSGRYQLLAIFRKSGGLLAYTIVRGKTRKEVVPTELKVGDKGYVYVSRELKRALMKAKRLGREMSVRTLDKIGVDDTHDRMAVRIAARDLNWNYILANWRRRGFRYRDNALVYLAMKGDTNAMCEVGFWFDVKKEKSEYWYHPDLADYWYRKAAEAGNPMGQANLSTLLAADCETMTPKVRDEMLFWIKAAAAQEFPAALRRLAKCCSCDLCGIFDAGLAAGYRARYEKVAPFADSSGRLPIHRTTRYGKMTQELMV